MRHEITQRAIDLIGRGNKELQRMLQRLYCTTGTLGAMILIPPSP